MSYIPTAPDLKIQIADRIRRYRKDVDNDNLRNSLLDRTGREEAGRYTTVGGALAAVYAEIRHRERYVYDPPEFVGNEHRVEVAAIARCHGHGCTDPEFTATHSGHWLLKDDADVPAGRAVELVQKAREWAQAHAEKCRAQAYSN